MMLLIVTWLPRVLGILLVIFIGIATLNVFGSGVLDRVGLLGFSIHLAPSLLLLADLVAAWRWEAIGGIAFILTGLVFLAWFGQAWLAALPAVVGLLFLFSRAYSLSRSSKTG